MLLPDFVKTDALIQLFNGSLEAFETQNQDRDVVERATHGDLPETDLDSLSSRDMLIIVELTLAALLEVTTGGRDLVWLPRGGLLSDPVPNAADDLLVVHPFEDAVAAKHEEIEVVAQFEGYDFGLANDNVHVAAVAGPFRLDIAEGLGDGQSPWKHSQWSLHIKILLVRRGGSLRKGLRPVYLTSGSLDALAFYLTVGLVIPTQHGRFSAAVHGHEAAAVTHVDRIGHIIYNNYNYSAAAGPLRADILPRVLLLGPHLGLLHH